MIYPHENYFLSANYAPVLDEMEVENLAFCGRIPRDLEGTYLRNGPNPAYEPLAYHYPLDGDGMIHSITIHYGRASYRNRFVQTRALAMERRAGKALFGSVVQPIMPDSHWVGADGQEGPIKNGACIHVLHHGGRYFALYEAMPGYELTKELETKGDWLVDGKSALPINAHTRLDPETGELFAFSYDFKPPFLSCYRLDQKAQLLENKALEIPYPVMMHDFALTDKHLVFFTCPACFQDPSSGGPFLKWDEEKPVRIGVIPRNFSEPMRWFETEPFWVYHFANAYEEGDHIYVDYARHHEFAIKEKPSGPPPHLSRMTLDLRTGKCKESAWNDLPMEFPRINEAFSAAKNRYIYFPTKDPKATLHHFHALLKFDLQTGKAQKHNFGKVNQIGEAVFAPKMGKTREDEGYVLIYVYDKTLDSSELVIIDAEQFDQPPVARIFLPRRVPHGLHGCWVPFDQT